MSGMLDFTPANMDSVYLYNWAYDRLTVNANYPASLGMFAEYNHTSRPIIRSGRLLNVNITHNLFSSPTGTHYVYYTLNSDEIGSQAGELKISDLANLVGMSPFNPANLYLACRVKAPSGSWKVYAQNTTLANSSTPEISIPIGTDLITSAGNYQIDCFLANGFHTNTSNPTGLIDRIAPLFYDSNNSNRFILRVISSMPASASLNGLGSIYTFIAGSSGTNLISEITYLSPAYYDDLEGSGTLHTNNYKNVAFKVTINPSSNFTLRRDDFTASLSGSSYVFPLFVQQSSEAYALRDSSTISFVSGVPKTLYLIYAGTQPIGSNGNTSQITLKVRDVVLAQTPHLRIDGNL